MPGPRPLRGSWLRRGVLGFAIVYGILAVVTVVAWATADDPLGALPAMILGLPWSPLLGRLAELAPGRTLWVGLVLALPLLVNLGVLAAILRWMKRRGLGEKHQ